MTKKFHNLFGRMAINYVLGIIFLVMALSVIAGPAVCLAQTPAGGGWWATAEEGGLNQVGQAYGGGDPRDIRHIIVDIIRIVLGFLGIIAVVLIIYAGFKWMTAGGNEENVATAKKTLLAGLIGLAIIVSAYVLANFVISYMYGAVSG